ncbi:MAG: cytochrome c biogenesis heme-transporting ATPase CcmA [Usitatibacter sp.]
MSALEAQALSCSRGPVTLFRDISFGLRDGEWIALRGPNGSGKTTLLRCAAGLTRPDAGRILWDGVDARREQSQFHAHLLYGGHAAGIKDDLTAMENLRDALALRALAPSDESIHAALAEVGLARQRHLPARRLSAGQRRRIGLARLLVDPARLWVLDEPLTALDDAGQAIFFGLLARHVEGGGLALVATHHDVKPAPTRVLVLSP